MTNKHYSIDSRILARKLIKASSTAFLIAVLEACGETKAPEESPKIEQIADSDRAELNELLDEALQVPEMPEVLSRPNTPVLVPSSKLDEVA